MSLTVMDHSACQITRAAQTFSSVCWISLILAFTVWILCCLPGRSNAETEAHRYLEKSGAQVHTAYWCLEKSDISTLNYQEEDETYITQTGPLQATLKWAACRPRQKTHVTARRQGDKIMIQGIYKGRPLQRAEHIDEDPWYQATSWSLRAFVLSPDRTIRFWSLRTDTLKAYHMEAAKRDPQKVVVNGKEEDAVPVELRLTGMLAPFWKGRYWFRAADGVFLRYQSPGGPPGTPDIQIEYGGPSTRACTVQNPGECSGQAHDQAGPK
jgi:hypothetical protein